MKRQDRLSVETLEPQTSQGSEKSRDKNCVAQQPYRSPQVLLVGKAQRLMAGYAAGSNYDGQGYTYP